MANVTFAVLGYNQEAYITEAIEGAFNQQHELLEIILVDDASVDDTPAIMAECAGKYSGSADIQVIVNEENLGCAGSVSKVMAHARGDLVILAGGDDISLPHRAGTLTKVWDRAGQPMVCLHSDVKAMDIDGRDIGAISGPWNSRVLSDPVQLLLKGGCMLGASVACPKSLFKYFGPFSVPGIGNTEDVALSFRSALMGGPIHVDQPLLLWRVGSGVSTSENKGLGRSGKVAREHIRFNQSLACTLMMEHDLAKWDGDKVRLRRALNKRRMVQDCIRCSYDRRIRTFGLAGHIVFDWLFDEKVNLRPVAQAVLRALSVRV